MDVAIQDLIVISPNGDAAFRAVFDFKAVNDVVAAVDVDADVAIGSVLSINDSAAGNFGLEGNWTGGSSAFAEMNPPTAVVIGVGAGFDYDDGTGGRVAIGADNRPKWLGRCS